MVKTLSLTRALVTTGRNLASLGPLVMVLLTLTATAHAQFTCTTNNNAITITGYTGPGGAVVIPDTITGLPVTAIGADAFFANTSLTGVTIPGSVTSIGAFAFAGCAALAGVTIPDGVTNLASYAFQGCSALTTVAIPGTVTSIAADVFIACASLRAITVDPLNPAYSSVDGVLFDASQTTLVEYPGGKTGPYTIPDGVTRVGDAAFGSCAGLTNITIPSSVGALGDSAFVNCSALAEVTLPESVTNLGNFAFQACPALTRVTLSSRVTSIGNGTFEGCTALASFTIPDSVTSLGLFPFQNCTALANVAIPASVTSIGSGAFEGCARLTAIEVDPLNPAYASEDGVLFDKTRTTLIQCPGGKAGGYHIPAGVGSIEDNAFMQCARLTRVTIPNSVTNIGNDAFFGCTTLASVALSDGLATIGVGAFENCARLTVAAIPKSVTSLGADAFYGCGGLTAITVDPLNPLYASLDGILFNQGRTILIQCPAAKVGRFTMPSTVTSIGMAAFLSCTGLTSVTIPASVTTIGDSAFENCTHLAGVTLPGGITSLGNSVFQDCASLSNVAIPGSVTSIGELAFQDCPRLTAVSIPDSVTSIGEGAFQSCAGLTNVTLGASVATLGTGAFAACTRLSTITVAALNPAYASVGGVLFNQAQTILVQCPGGQAGSYTVPDNVTNLAADAFMDCAGLTTVTLPASLTSIGNGAFSGCGGLTGLYFAGNAPSLSSPLAALPGGGPLALIVEPPGGGGRSGRGGLGLLPVFSGDNVATVYHLPSTTGWGATFGGLPTAPWHGLALSGSPAFGRVALGASTFEILTISNQTSSAFTVSRIICPLGFSADWQGGTIPAGGAQGVQITFQPNGIREYSGAITVVSDAAGGTGQIAISGLGVPAGMAPNSRWVQNLTFTLKAWSQGSPKPTGIGNKDLISALSGETLSGSGSLPGFRPGAQLLTEQSLGSTDTRVIVRQISGTNTIDYDVTSAFAPPAPVADLSPVAYVKSGLAYSHALTTFAFSATNGLSFVLSGLTTGRETVVDQTNCVNLELSGTVAGSGLVHGVTNLFGGTVSLSGGHLE